MSESDNRDVVERFFKAADAQDWTTDEGVLPRRRDRGVATVG